MFCVPLKIFQFSYFTRCFSFVFIEHCRHFDDFIITTKTFPVSSKEMSTIPTLDNHPLVPNEPSALALILITWFRSVCLSIFESIWPTVFRYRFTMKASSFRLFSKGSSVTSVKTSVCLLQQVGCTGGCNSSKVLFFCCGMSLSNWTQWQEPTFCLSQNIVHFLESLLCYRICWYHMP